MLGLFLPKGTHMFHSILLRESVWIFHLLMRLGVDFKKWNWKVMIFLMKSTCLKNQLINRGLWHQLYLFFFKICQNKIKLVESFHGLMSNKSLLIFMMRESNMRHKYQLQLLGTQWVSTNFLFFTSFKNLKWDDWLKSNYSKWSYL